MARRHTRFIRPPARTKMWIGAGVGETVISSASITLLGTLSAGALLLRPFTILRTRMDILYCSDQVTASETARGGIGSIVVTDTAAGIGVTAIPDPSGVTGDPEADWFVHQMMSTRLGLATSVGFDGAMGVHYVIDSKAMRKVGPDDDVATQFSQDSSTGALLITGGRRLIQLH